MGGGCQAFRTQTGPCVRLEKDESESLATRADKPKGDRAADSTLSTSTSAASRDRRRLAALATMRVLFPVREVVEASLSHTTHGEAEGPLTGCRAFRLARSTCMTLRGLVEDGPKNE